MSRKSLALFICFVIILCSFCGCGQATNTAMTDETETNTLISMKTGTVSPEGSTHKVEKTAIQAQEARYVPIDEVGSYNDTIITQELLSSCKLPQLDKASLPYWTGFIMEEKISVNYRNDEWDSYTGGGWYWNEEELRYMAENGFNCVRVCYSLSFLSNPEDVEQINIAELEQLDELISWCIKYNLHLIISQTGLAGKWGSWGENWHSDFDYWNNEEGVGGETKLYTSSELQDINLRYYEMLAKRYMDIPNSVFSFELAVESNTPEGDTQLQADVLGPVAEMIWSYTPDRIVIVNDNARLVPKELAELGCCISLHGHIYSIDGNPLKDLFDLKYEPHWPMQYLPSFVNENTNPLIIRADGTFADGNIVIYTEYRGDAPIVTIDGNTVMNRTYGEPIYVPESFTIAIPGGAEEIKIEFPAEVCLLGISITQEGNTVTLVSHGTYNNSVYSYSSDAMEKMPSLRVNKDMTITDISEEPVIIDAEYMENVFLRPFMETAKENGVSFIATEVGSDSAGGLSPEEYFSYESCWLDALEKNGVGWMYNCTHNIVAPENLMWLNKYNSKFTDFSEIKNMYGYSVNNQILDFLKSYSK